MMRNSHRLGVAFTTTALFVSVSLAAPQAVKAGDGTRDERLSRGVAEDNGSTDAMPAPVGTRGAAGPRNSAWAAITASPLAVSRPAGAAMAGHFYIIGGESTVGPRQGLVQDYDASAGTWDATSPIMPTVASNLSAAVIGTDIYIPGGYTGTVALATLQVFTPSTDTWQTIATDPLPAARFGLACASESGKLYVIGGTDAGGVYYNTTYIYDPAAAAGARWTTGLAAPITGGYGNAIAAGGYIFWAGMRNATTDLAGVYRYDPIGNTWTTMPSLTTARGAAQVWTYEGKLAVGGGGWASYLTSVEEYDLSTGTGGTWTAGAALIGGRRTFAAGQDNTNGVLYAGAGWSGAFMNAAIRSTFCIGLTLAPPTLPGGNQGVAYSQTIAASGGTAPYTYAVTVGTLPAGLSLDLNTGVLAGTPTGTGTSNFTVTATDASVPACTGLLAYSIDVVGGCPTITILPATLPNGTTGAAYSQTVAASGGTAPYTYAVTTGTLPAGLALDVNTGVISGTPTVAATSNFDVTATDVNTCPGVQNYDLTVDPGCQAIALAPATLPNGVEGLAYSQTITATGGTAPYTYGVTTGTLPAGVTLTAAGVLSGSPTTAGTSNFTVTATDTNACTGFQAYTMTVTPAVDFVVGEGLGDSGGGNTNRVRVFRRDNTAVGTIDFQAYGASNWGTNVASANINGGAYGEILTGPGPGGVYGPQVKGFDRAGIFMAKVNFYAYGTLRYGVNVGGGDLDNDGFGEIVSGAGPGDVFGPHVRGWNFDNGTLATIAKVNFFAFSTLKYGVNVEEGNVDGDNYPEILAGAGPGTVFASNVRGFNYDNATVLQMGKINFFAYPGLVWGVNVAGGDVDNDGFAELATAPGPGSAATYTTTFIGWQFDNVGISQATGFNTTAWTTTLYGGRVNLADVNSDGSWDLLAGRGRDPLADSETRRYDYSGTTLTQTGTFVPFAAAGYGYGVNVAGGPLGHY